MRRALIAIALAASTASCAGPGYDIETNVFSWHADGYAGADYCAVSPGSTGWGLTLVSYENFPDGHDWLLVDIIRLPSGAYAWEITKQTDANPRPPATTMGPRERWDSGHCGATVEAGTPLGAEFDARMEVTGECVGSLGTRLAGSIWLRCRVR